jgi:hypothetical protein
MFAIDAAIMALDLRQIAENEGTQGSRIVYTLHYTDGI